MLALNYMHSKNVSHRDLKPENMMVSKMENGELFIKLTDFGFACFFDPQEKMDIILGTPIYMAPELVIGTTYDCRVDVWSLGVITYILLCGKPPFDGESTDMLKEEILHKELVYDSSLFGEVSNAAIDFTKLCLNRDTEERSYINELLQHPWIERWVVNSELARQTSL